MFRRRFLPTSTWTLKRGFLAKAKETSGGNPCRKGSRVRAPTEFVRPRSFTEQAGGKQSHSVWLDQGEASDLHHCQFNGSRYERDLGLSKSFAVSITAMGRLGFMMRMYVFASNLFAISRLPCRGNQVDQAGWLLLLPAALQKFRVRARARHGPARFEI